MSDTRDVAERLAERLRTVATMNSSGRYHADLLNAAADALLREPSVGREPDALLVSASNLLRRWINWCGTTDASFVPLPGELMHDSHIVVNAIGTPSDSPEREAPPSAEEVECSECGVPFRDDFKPVCPSCGPLEPVRRFGATPPEEASEGDT